MVIEMLMLFLYLLISDLQNPLHPRLRRTHRLGLKTRSVAAAT